MPKKLLETPHLQYLKKPSDFSVSSSTDPSYSDLTKYKLAYTMSERFHLLGSVTIDNFSKILNTYPDLTNGEIKDNYLNLIIRNFIILRNKPTFYFAIPVKAFLEKIQDISLKENVDSLISEVKNEFILKNLATIEHRILVTSAKKIDNWPGINFPATTAYLGTTSTPHSPPSLFDLQRYLLHIKVPTLTEFSFKIKSDPDSERLNTELRENLRTKGLLNSANQIKAKFLYVDGTNPNPPALQSFRNSILEFLKAKFNPLPCTEELINQILNQNFEQAKNDRKELNQLKNFHPFKALYLAIQSLEYHLPATAPIAIRDVLIHAAPSKLITDRLYETLLIAYKNFEVRADASGSFQLAELIVGNICSNNCYRLIIQSGDPIKNGNQNTGHYFYLAITKLADKVTISIINGGSNPQEDPAFDESESGPGNYLIARTIKSINFDEAYQDFLKHYIYTALSIQYTKGNYQQLLDNLYLKGDFQGYNSYYKASDELASIIEIMPSENSPSFPSQTFSSCTVHNLKYALKILFNWHEYQFTHFVNSFYVQYNFLLKQSEIDGFFIEDSKVGNVVLSIDASIYDPNYGQPFDEIANNLISLSDSAIGFIADFSKTKLLTENFEGSSSSLTFKFDFQINDALLLIKATNSFVDIIKFYNEPNLEHGKVLLRDCIHLQSIVQGNNIYSTLLVFIDMFDKFYHSKAYDGISQGITSLSFMLLPMATTIFAPQYYYAYGYFMLGLNAISLASNIYSFYINSGDLESQLKSKLTYSNIYIYLGMNDAAKNLVYESLNIVEEDAKSFKDGSNIQNIASKYQLYYMVDYLGIELHHYNDNGMF